jgi:serine/threonine-protein kinase
LYSDVEPAPSQLDSFEALMREAAHVSDAASGTFATTYILPEIGTVVSGKYRIDRVLGRGGMGAVFAATHVVTGRRFALKWMLIGDRGHPSATERFLQEAKAAGRIHHPNVIDVFDVGYDHDAPFLVMELLEGASLAERLRAEPMRLGQSLAIFRCVLRGVAAAHRCGVIHRDLKPENIVLARSADGLEVPVIVDFGVSKLLGPDPAITHPGAVLGTPAFMAPEQFRGQPVDRRADVYALGVLLYTMLAGTRAELPRCVTSALDRAMACRPDDRFPDVDAFAAALEPASSGESRRAVGPFTTWLLLIVLVLLASGFCFAATVHGAN